ncbi:unnamed protein product [Medioppia subpectinata]|uniref:Uncharacterized protein n=1 Tax=Medioppia subpectinata TaxID=1979941 RepID=A0A7R9KVC6_9ACAR|nr:unnamed protein product [Medioppia subpectinata]CAG2109367.1 unnamed protein product [Medioppia subpectinata]
MLDNMTSIETIGQRPKIWSLAQTATSHSPPYNGKVGAGPLTPTDWAPTLPPGPDAPIAPIAPLSLSDYQRDCPQGSRFATNNLRKCGQTWPEDHYITNIGTARSAAIQLFSSDPIASHNYFNTQPKTAMSGPFVGNGGHPHPLQLSTPVPHLVHTNVDPFGGSYNGIRPIIDSQSSHNMTDINENRLPNGSVSKSNTFLCKVFPDYISSGPDALSLNDNNSERGGSTLSVEESSLSLFSLQTDVEEIVKPSIAINKNTTFDFKFGFRLESH